MILNDQNRIKEFNSEIIRYLKWLSNLKMDNYINLLQDEPNDFYTRRQFFEFLWDLGMLGKTDLETLLNITNG